MVVAFVVILVYMGRILHVARQEEQQQQHSEIKTCSQSNAEAAQELCYAIKLLHARDEERNH